MGYANGRLPQGALAPIPGTSPRAGGRPLLRKDASRAYTALHNYAVERWGISMALGEGSIRRAYREYPAQVAARQMWCAQGRCGNAATPGTSNHGLGINVDLVTRQQRWVIDQVGARFGFSKRWSDAAWEWWHITYRSGTYPMVAKHAASSSPTLRRGQKGPSIVKLKHLLYKRGIRGFSGSRKPNNNRSDPFFGLNTKRAVQRYQKKKGLKADGTVGPATWSRLQKP